MPKEQRFEVLERHVKDFLAFKYQKTDFNIRHIDHEFIDGFDFYLHTSKDNGTIPQASTLKILVKLFVSA